jgi:hypothetical protein
VNTNDVIAKLMELAAQCEDAAERQDVQAAMSAIIFRRDALEREREKAAKHPELVEGCAILRDRVDKLKQELEERVNILVEPVYAKIHAAHMALKEHLDQRPRRDEYPTRAELEMFEQEAAALQAAVEEAEKAARELNSKRNALTAELTEALRAFAIVAAEERRLRPAESSAVA